MSAAEIISTVLVLTGALVALTASIGLLRFRDTTLTHARRDKTADVRDAAGAVRRWSAVGHNVDIGMLILAGLFVMITAPVVAQRIGQLAYREQRADSGLTRSPPRSPPRPGVGAEDLPPPLGAV